MLMIMYVNYVCTCPRYIQLERVKALGVPFLVGFMPRFILTLKVVFVYKVIHVVENGCSFICLYML